MPIPRLINRREFVVAGGLSTLGLSVGDLRRLRASVTSSPEEQKRRRNSCIFLFLFGGPRHIDLWDMKPKATEQVRGEFRPAATVVPGIQICENLPRLARVMDKVCLVRSMTHRMNVHGPACSEIFSGRPFFGPPTTDQASREDWPSLSALVARYGHGTGGLPPSAVLPWYVQFPGQPKRIAGQTGARMGERYNAFLVPGEFNKSDFELQGIKLGANIPVERLHDRRDLLERLKGDVGGDPSLDALQRNRRAVYELLGSGAGAAFDLRTESASVRDRYGRTNVGQSLLLARRLVEAGVELVSVNWHDETTIDGVNTCWDTHQNLVGKLKSLLCPTFDQAFPSFLEDLHQRGLLETTLVVAVGEFGRTPKIGQFTQSSNTQKTGRDHWPHAFTALLAGGGVRGGQVYGATTSDGGYVADKPVTPADLSATILHHLGIDYTQQYEDEVQRSENRLSDGHAIRDFG
ncbi:DUF1501 domain-containing protein [soil metagenome]